MARCRDRPPCDPRLAERNDRPSRPCQRCGARAVGRRPPRQRVLGGVVPGGLDLGDARADPAVVLLDLVHGRDARGSLAVQTRADLREAARRDRTRDAPLVGQRHRGRRGTRAYGRRRDALAVLLAAFQSEPLFRVRARVRDPATAADAVELREVSRRLREHRELDAHLARSGGRSGGRAAAARPLAGRAHERARHRGGGSLRKLGQRQRQPCLRRVSRGRLELVHQALPAAVLGRRRDCVPDPLVRARAGRSGDLAGHAVPRRLPLATAHLFGRGSPELGLPRRLA